MGNDGVRWGGMGIKKWINHSIITTVKLIRNSLINQMIFPFMRYKDNMILSHTKLFSFFFPKIFTANGL
jgi:hypothetical protein